MKQSMRQPTATPGLPVMPVFTQESFPGYFSQHRIVFETTRAGNPDIRMMKADWSNATNLIPDQSAREWDAKYVPSRWSLRRSRSDFAAMQKPGDSE